jgi:hypothetical protein
LVVVPTGVNESKLHRRLNGNSKAITVLQATTSGITVCREIDSVPLRELAHHLIHGRDIYRELARSLHARLDVKWCDFAQDGIHVGVREWDNPDATPLSKTTELSFAQA